MNKDNSLNITNLQKAELTVGNLADTATAQLNGLRAASMGAAQLKWPSPRHLATERQNGVQERINLLIFAPSHLARPGNQVL